MIKTLYRIEGKLVLTHIKTRKQYTFYGSQTIYLSYDDTKFTTASIGGAPSQPRRGFKASEMQAVFQL